MQLLMYVTLFIHLCTVVYEEDIIMFGHYEERHSRHTKYSLFFQLFFNKTNCMRIICF